MRVINYFILLMLVAVSIQAQVGIGTDAPVTTLDVRGTNHLGAVAATDGVTVPRVNDLTTNGVEEGQLVYLNTDVATFKKGFHYWDGTVWTPLNTNDGDAWAVTGEDQTANVFRKGSVAIGYTAAPTPATAATLQTTGNVIMEKLTEIPTNESGMMLSVLNNGTVVRSSWGIVANYEFTGTPLYTELDDWSANLFTASGTLISGQNRGHLILQVRHNEGEDGLLVINNSNNLIMKLWAATGNLRILGSRAFKPGSTTWENPSDFRIKKNITDFTDGMDVINKLNPVTYQYNGKGGVAATGETFVGFVAQEVEKAAPYMVNTAEGENGDIKDLKTIDESALTKILVNAMKEKDSQVKELQETVKNQQAQIDALMMKVDALTK